MNPARNVKALHLTKETTMTKPSKSLLAPIVIAVALMTLAAGISAMSLRSEATVTDSHTFVGTEPAAPATPEPQPSTF